MAINLLMGAGFIGRPYYNGVPDIAAGGDANSRVRTREILKRKLKLLVIPKVPVMDDLQPCKRL